MNTRNKTITILFILTALIAVVLMFLWMKRSSYRSDIKDSDINSQAAQSSKEGQGSLSQPESTTPVAAKTTDKQPADIPILMYHHIRDFNEPADQIGTNLSVAPAKFSDQLDLIEESSYQTITFEDIKRGEIPDKPIILTFDDGYDNFYANAFPQIKKRRMKAVVYFIVNFIGQSGYMNQDQIKEIKSDNIEVGSHTLSHPGLISLSVERAGVEISESKAELERLFGGRVVSFCYPSGQFNEAVKAEVKAAGYDFAVTTKGGIAHFSDPFELKRYRLNADTNLSAYLK